MKVCFVVLAHHNPIVFRKLIRNIGSDHSPVVVHIDRRADIREFGEDFGSNVHFNKKRTNVHWAGWSQARAIIETLEFALQRCEADYFIFLAGTDFPIRPPGALRDFLGQKSPTYFLSQHPLVPGIWTHRLVDRFHVNDLKSLLGGSLQAPNVSVFRKVMRSACAGYESVLNACFVRKTPSGLRLYGGSSRWCLNADAARYVTEFYRSPESRKFRDFLKYSANSDELFVQTAILNSPHKAHCAEFDESQALDIFSGRRQPMADENRAYLHYIDWSAGRENPAILVDSDFQALKDSGKFFASKFLDDKSLGLIKRIQDELL